MQDHKIVLKDGSQPVSMTPYYYPYYQKAGVEKIVKEQLETRVSRPNQSLFSSPLLLVRKTDGIWRICIDYRALNQAKTKDKYPILVVDKLLDELQGATIFSKLKLRFGYHQIRIRE